MSNTNPLPLQHFKFQNTTLYVVYWLSTLWQLRFSGYIYFSFLTQVLLVLLGLSLGQQHPLFLSVWLSSSHLLWPWWQFLLGQLLAGERGGLFCVEPCGCGLWNLLFIVKIYLKTRQLARPFLTHQKVSWWWRLWNWPHGQPHNHVLEMVYISWYIFVAVPCRNQTLFHCVFCLHYHVRSTLVQGFH